MRKRKSILGRRNWLCKVLEEMKSMVFLKIYKELNMKNMNVRIINSSGLRMMLRWW